MVPSELHPALTTDRLAFIAGVIVRSRDGAVDAFAPDTGETFWSLGCRALERAMHAIVNAAPLTNGWLTILDPSRHFRFAIEGVPIGVYRGKPRRPNASTLKVHHSELRALQQSFPEMMKARQQLIVRLAIETNDDGRVEQLSLVQIDEHDAVLEVWLLWSRQSTDLGLPSESSPSGSPPKPTSGALMPMRAPAKNPLRRPRVQRRRKGSDETGSGSVDG